MKKKIVIGKDLKEYLSNEKTNMAESHLESWKERYCAYGGNKKRLIEDLYINHDSSLEIERIEEDLKRELTSEEHDFAVAAFNKEVVRVWSNK
jgi:hypothetical protein